MYTTNKEYRDCIREFCKMNCEDKTIGLDIDDESRDEQMFDGIACNKTMDFIFEKTKDIPLWQDIYDKAAGKFISTNREIGLSVLFSYDFFWDFKECWNSFLRSLEINSEHLEIFDENNSFYKSLDSLL